MNQMIILLSALVFSHVCLAQAEQVEVNQQDKKHTIAIGFGGAWETYKDESVSVRSMNGIKAGASLGYEYKTPKWWISVYGSLQSGFYNFDEINYTDRVANGTNMLIKANAQKQVYASNQTEVWAGLQSRYQYEVREILFFTNSDDKDFYIWDTGLQSTIVQQWQLFGKSIHTNVGLSLPLIAYSAQTPFSLALDNESQFTDKYLSTIGNDFFGVGIQFQPSIDLGSNQIALAYQWNYLQLDAVELLQVDNQTLGIVFRLNF